MDVLYLDFTNFDKTEGGIFEYQQLEKLLDTLTRHYTGGINYTNYSHSKIKFLRLFHRVFAKHLKVMKIQISLLSGCEDNFLSISGLKKLM